MVDDAPFDSNMIGRAISLHIAKHKFEVEEGAAVPVPLWVIVKSIFGYGSTRSSAICRKYGYNPEEIIGDSENE
jgi:hypothetical protein